MEVKKKVVNWHVLLDIHSTYKQRTVRLDTFTKISRHVNQLSVENCTTKSCLTTKIDNKYKMDIKDIIKWLIHCVVLNLRRNLVLNLRLCLLLPPCLLFLFFFRECSAMDSSESEIDNIYLFKNFSSISNINNSRSMFGGLNMKETSRTFGGPRIKKLLFALIPLVFQLGAASTWAMISAILSFKAVAIGLLLLMMNVAAGVAKLTALFSSKWHHQLQHHEPVHWQPQKEVHVHIHNSGGGHQGGHEEYYGDPWSRGGQEVSASNIYGTTAPITLSNLNAGPQTINTPYGSYVRVGPPQT